MRWTAVSCALIIVVLSFGGAAACPDECADSELPWWRFLLYPLIVAGILWLWNWWFGTPAGVTFAPDDPEKLVATEEARRTLPIFWQAFDNPAPDESEFALKFNLTPHADAELIWALDLKRENGRIYGRLGNEPFAPGYSQDVYYEINPDHIVDWAYTKGNVAQGHFVTRLMFQRIPKRFAKRGQRALGWA